MRMHINEAGGNGAITGIDDRVSRRKCLVLFQDGLDLLILDKYMPDEWPISKTIYYYAIA